MNSRQWSRSIARAAITTKFLSGVELRYYHRYLDEGIDVKSFFKPYKHADVILSQRNINVFHPQEERLNERASLIGEYKTFLNNRKQEKSYKKIDHDMTVLDKFRRYVQKLPPRLKLKRCLLRAITRFINLIGKQANN